MERHLERNPRAVRQQFIGLLVAHARAEIVGRLYLGLHAPTVIQSAHLAVER